MHWGDYGLPIAGCCPEPVADLPPVETAPALTVRVRPLDSADDCLLFAQGYPDVEQHCRRIVAEQDPLGQIERYFGGYGVTLVIIPSGVIVGGAKLNVGSSRFGQSLLVSWEPG